MLKDIDCLEQPFQIQSVFHFAGTTGRKAQLWGVMKVGIVKETRRFGGKQGARGNKCEFHKYRINRILRDFYSENMLRMRQEQGFYHNKGRRMANFSLLWILHNS